MAEAAFLAVPAAFCEAHWSAGRWKLRVCLKNGASDGREGVSGWRVGGLRGRFVVARPGSCPMSNFSHGGGRASSPDGAQGPIARDGSADGCMQARASPHAQPEKPAMELQKPGAGLACKFSCRRHGFRGAHGCKVLRLHRTSRCGREFAPPLLVEQVSRSADISRLQLLPLHKNK